mmetsp:Transcript_19704/g.29236  ORF Transcript_19704/g.29236 Transcript_19704/m.29236 type:complete len:90 (-) Transcript_19704:121-390(-)
MWMWCAAVFSSFDLSATQVKDTWTDIVRGSIPSVSRTKVLKKGPIVGINDDEGTLINILQQLGSLDNIDLKTPQNILSLLSSSSMNLKP